MLALVVLGRGCWVVGHLGTQGRNWTLLSATIFLMALWIDSARFQYFASILVGAGLGSGTWHTRASRHRRGNVGGADVRVTPAHAPRRCRAGRPRRASLKSGPPNAARETISATQRAASSRTPLVWSGLLPRPQKSPHIQRENGGEPRSDPGVRAPTRLGGGGGGSRSAYKSTFPDALGKPKRQIRKKRSKPEVQVQNRYSDARRTERAKQQGDADACIRKRAGRTLNRDLRCPRGPKPYTATNFVGRSPSVVARREVASEMDPGISR